MEHPDPKKHQFISFAKSAVRIFGCLAAIASSMHGIYILAVSLALAEMIGIYEELV